MQIGMVMTLQNQNGTSTDPCDTNQSVIGGTWMRWQNPLYYEHQHNDPDDCQVPLRWFDRSEDCRS